jgi:hypothetical protein
MSVYRLFASMLNGTSFGALLFVGAVDARTFLALADKKDAAVSATIFRHFLPIGGPMDEI